MAVTDIRYKSQSLCLWPMSTRFIWVTHCAIPRFDSIAPTYQQLMFVTKAQEANRGDAEAVAGRWKSKTSESLNNYETKMTACSADTIPSSSQRLSVSAVSVVLFLAAIIGIADLVQAQVIPANLEGLVSRAIELEKSKDYAAAEAVYKEALVTSPDDPEVGSGLSRTGQI